MELSVISTDYQTCGQSEERDSSTKLGLMDCLIILFFSIIVTMSSLWAEISNIRNNVQISTDQLVYTIIMWTLGTVAFLLNNLVIYLILRKSTTEIKEYKLYLLNFTLADYFFCILLSWTLEPSPIVPGGGMIIIGISRRLGGFWGHVQFTLIAYCFAHSIVSLNYCFIYRYASLCDAAARRLLERRWYKIMLFGSGEVACFSVAMLIFDMRVPEEHFKSVTLERFPYQAASFENTIFFGYDYKQSAHANTFLISALVLAPLSCAFNFLCAMLIINRLHQYRHQLSHRTYKMHLKLLFALLLQTTVPLVLFILPMVYIFISAFKLLAGPLTNTFTRYMPTITLAMHPIINPCITIAFIEPYRRVVVPEFILNVLRKKPSQIIVNVTSTTGAQI